MPAIGLQFPGDRGRLKDKECVNQFSFQTPDEELLHNDNMRIWWYGLTKRNEQKSLVDEGTFQFHKDIVLSDGSALLLNKRTLELLYMGNEEQINARVGEEVWVPHRISQRIDGFQRTSNEVDGAYYKATILGGGGSQMGGVLVSFKNGVKRNIHVADIRKSPPPARGRGGDKRSIKYCDRIWAPPFRQWKDDEVWVDIHKNWIPGSTITRRIGGIDCEFTVPEDIETLPWNKSNTFRQFILKMPNSAKVEWKYKKREWDKLNEEALIQAKEKELSGFVSSEITQEGVCLDDIQGHSGYEKMFDESPYPHYIANVLKANPDGTIVIKWMNGYTDEKYNPDMIGEEQLDAINYRVPQKMDRSWMSGMGLKPYNPPEFAAADPSWAPKTRSQSGAGVGENVDVDYERSGHCSPAKIVKENADGTYVTSYSCLGKEIIEENTPHDIIYKATNNIWNMRIGDDSSSFRTDYPKMDTKEEEKLHQTIGAGDEVWGREARQVINSGLVEDGGILSWATWFRKSPLVKTSREQNLNDHDIIQFCLGKKETISLDSDDCSMRSYAPAIFKWSVPNPGTLEPHNMALKDICRWSYVKTVEEDDVKGCPLLETIYKMSLMETGIEEGNGDLFAKYFMEFAEVRKEKTLMHWIPQQFEHLVYSEGITKEEDKMNTLLSANMKLEEKIRNIEKETSICIKELNNKIAQLEKKSESGSETKEGLNDLRKRIDDKIVSDHEKTVKQGLWIGLITVGVAIVRRWVA